MKTNKTKQNKLQINKANQNEIQQKKYHYENVLILNNNVTFSLQTSHPHYHNHYHHNFFVK